MALKATIFKATLQIADMDRPYYGTHSLTVARHPSETDERMMMRLLAFALHASDDLAFTRGLSTDDEPDLWQRDPSGVIQLWIDLGQPDPRRIRKACGRSRQVFIYPYSTRGAAVWWQQNRERLARHDNLSVLHVPGEGARSLGRLAARNMDLQCTIQERQLWFGTPQETVELNLAPWLMAGE